MGLGEKGILKGMLCPQSRETKESWYEKFGTLEKIVTVNPRQNCQRVTKWFLLIC